MIGSDGMPYKVYCVTSRGRVGVKSGGIGTLRIRVEPDLHALNSMAKVLTSSNGWKQPVYGQQPRFSKIAEPGFGFRDALQLALKAIGVHHGEHPLWNTTLPWWVHDYYDIQEGDVRVKVEKTETEEESKGKEKHVKLVPIKIPPLPVTKQESAEDGLRYLPKSVLIAAAKQAGVEVTEKSKGQVINALLNKI